MLKIVHCTSGCIPLSSRPLARKWLNAISGMILGVVFWPLFAAALIMTNGCFLTHVPEKKYSDIRVHVKKSLGPQKNFAWHGSMRQHIRRQAAFRKEGSHPMVLGSLGNFARVFRYPPRRSILTHDDEVPTQKSFLSKTNSAWKFHQSRMEWRESLTISTFHSFHRG